jgi:hypothetical protein
MALIGLLTAATLAPIATPVVIAQTTRDYPEDLFLEEEAQTQTDMLAYVVPSRHNVLWGHAVKQVYDSFALDQRLVASLGYVTLALAAHGAVRYRRDARLWLFVALITVVLALGPVLRVAGRVYPAIPMPYQLVGDLFFIKAVRRPDRFNLILSLPVAMLAAFGVRALLDRSPFSRRSLLVTGALGALILLEYCPVPYPTVDPSTPAWFDRLANEPGRFAILDLPTYSRIYDKQYMFYQITHGKPLVEGHVARTPREALTFIDTVPFLSYAREHQALDSTLTDVSRELNQLAEADVRYVVLHKEPMQPDQLAAWRDWLTIDPCHEDEDLIVYRTDPQLGRDFQMPHIFADGIGSIETTAAPSETTQAGLIEVHAVWGSASAPGSDYDACVSLVSPEGKVAQSHCEPLSPDWPPAQWPANAIVRGTYALQVGPFIQPSTYTLTLSLAQSSARTPVGLPLPLGSVQVNGLPRVFAEPAPDHTVQAHWGDQILLRGYDLQHHDDTVNLTLYWQAQQRMSNSYKVFVHAIDPADGTIITQADTVPRQWTYPTTWWEQSEIVSDPIHLSADGLGNRAFRLVVGLTDLATGVRLPVYGPQDQRYADDAFPLTSLGE